MAGLALACAVCLRTACYTNFQGSCYRSTSFVVFVFAHLLTHKPNQLHAKIKNKLSSASHGGPYTCIHKGFWILVFMFVFVTVLIVCCLLCYFFCPTGLARGMLLPSLSVGVHLLCKLSSCVAKCSRASHPICSMICMA